MNLRTGSLHAGGCVARSTDGRRTVPARWPVGELHALDRHQRALCGAPIRYTFETVWDPDGPDACPECVRLAGHVERIVPLVREALGVE